MAVLPIGGDMSPVKNLPYPPNGGARHPFFTGVTK
jgi:hypothetical protein